MYIPDYTQYHKYRYDQPYYIYPSSRETVPNLVKGIVSNSVGNIAYSLLGNAALMYYLHKNASDLTQRRIAKQAERDRKHAEIVALSKKTPLMIKTADNEPQQTIDVNEIPEVINVSDVGSTGKKHPIKKYYTEETMDYITNEFAKPPIKTIFNIKLPTNVRYVKKGFVSDPSGSTLIDEDTLRFLKFVDSVGGLDKALSMKESKNFASRDFFTREGFISNFMNPEIYIPKNLIDVVGEDLQKALKTRIMITRKEPTSIEITRTGEKSYKSSASYKYFKDIYDSMSGLPNEKYDKAISIYRDAFGIDPPIKFTPKKFEVKPKQNI